MSVHLVVPGLLWPQDSLRETVRDLRLPALAALLGRGERRYGAGKSLHTWLRSAFGLGDGEIPWGALRRRAETESAVEGYWMCADPVHMRFVRDALVLVEGDEVGIEADEAHDLVAALNTHFADIGRFEAATPQRWYLRVDTAPDMRTHVLDDVIGRNYALFLPDGARARHWRAMLNEAQMLLHAHARNTAREEAGKPTINSLWLWGAGALPTAVDTSFTAVFSDNPIVIGLAGAAGIAVAALPRAGSKLHTSGGKTLVVADGLQSPGLHLDAAAWRAELARLEEDWFAPLLGELYSGRLRELRLSALGDDASVDIVLDPQDRWRFWRRPLCLADLDVAKT